MLRLFVILATVFAFSNVSFANDANDAHKKPATTEVSKDAQADKEGVKKEAEEEGKEGDKKEGKK